MASWLQGNRVEVNAMTTPQFLAWLDRKFADQGGKLVPPAEVVADRFGRDVRERVRTNTIDRELREAEVDRRVEDAVHTLLPSIQERASVLRNDVARDLEAAPAQRRTTPVARAAEALVETLEGAA